MRDDSTLTHQIKLSRLSIQKGVLLRKMKRAAAISPVDSLVLMLLTA